MGPPRAISIFSFPITSFDATTRSRQAENDAFQTETITQNTTSDETFDSVLFTGDIMLARHVERLIWQHGSSYPFLGINFDSFSSAPAVVGNFESSMCEPHRPTPFYTMRFSTRKEALVGLKNAGFTHVSLANNHSFDCGEDGYANTWGLLEESEITPFGSQKTIDKNSLSYIKTPIGVIALIGIHVVYQDLDQEKVAEVFGEADTKSDYQIAYIHWGNEYEIKHSKTQRRHAEALVSLGADMIIGHHPHVVQGIEYIQSVPVFYSLGNYVFDQYFSDEVKTGLLLELAFFDGGPVVRLHGVSSKQTPAQPQLLKDDERTAFLRSLAERSDKVLETHILLGNLPLQHMVATSTKIAIMVQ